MNDEQRYAELPIAEQIAEAETRLARLELELARSGGAQRDHRAVEHAERRLDELKARAARQERLERAEARRAAAGADAVKAHADTVKKNGAQLKKDREALTASRDRADRAVKAAGEAVTAALKALAEHSDAVAATAGRLEALGLPLVDEFDNRFEVGGSRRAVGVPVVRLGGDSFKGSYPREREHLVTETARKAVLAAQPNLSTAYAPIREAHARREAGRQAEAERARQSVAVRRPA